MIVLDTNVVSELQRPTPHAGVVSWVRRQDPSDLAITAVTASELLYGMARLPQGQRSRLLAEAFEVLVTDVFDGRVLPFDLSAARLTGMIRAQRRAAGRAISDADAQIAGTCLLYGAALVSRDRRGFEGTGVELIDPWTVGGLG